MHETRNDLPKQARKKLIALLEARLADAVDLYTQIKQAHWTVKGPHFIALHELFDAVGTRALPWADDLAERIQQLGGTARGTARSVAKRSSLTEYPEGLDDGHAHVVAVADRLAAFGKSIRKAIDESDALGDKDTADLFTEISRAVDKDLWFVEAHLQAKH